MTTIANQLKAARKLIEREDAWCKGTAARDASGQRVTFDEPSASAWCAMGALFRVEAYSDAEEALAAVCGAVAPFNDTHSHADVLAAFDRAIARAET